MMTDTERNNSEHDEKVMPFLDHLEELRSRLLKSFAAIILVTIGCYFFSKDIMVFLTKPFPYKLVFLSPAESFIIHIKISMFAGILISLPYLFYQLWQFVVPGLMVKERRYVPSIIFFSTLFFLLGASFCYFVAVPLALDFLLSWQADNLLPFISVKEYLKFVTMFVFAFGIVFELPLMTYFLAKLGILSPQFMSKNRRYSTVIIFVLAAVLTPSGDIISQLILAIPLLILYEASIIVARVVYKKKHEK